MPAFTFTTGALFAIALAAALCHASAHAEAPLTLAQALAEARAANAQLPVSALNVAIADRMVAESRGRLGPSFAVTGQVRVMPPTLDYGPGTNPAEEILQLTGRQPLFAGGTLRAQLQADRYALRSSRARFRADERDLMLEVRSRFSEVLALDAEVAARAEGTDRLVSYLTFVRSRAASGQGVQSDLLKTEARLETEEADLIATRTSLAEAKVKLNDLLGRDPMRPLSLAPLPPPGPPPSTRPPGASLPDIAAADADRLAARERIQIAHGRLLPQLALSADVGWIDPGLETPDYHVGPISRLRNDFGMSVGVDLTWNLWSYGVFEAMQAQARLAAEQAAKNLIVAKRQANLAYARARTDLDLGYQELQQRERTLPVARDAFIEAESIYRGGAGSALEVLDAFTTLVDAQLAYAEALYGYRVAQAAVERWSAP